MIVSPIQIISAESQGFYDGLKNRHWIGHTYHTAEEYVAWLRGWRRGQMKRKEQESFL